MILPFILCHHVGCFSVLFYYLIYLESFDSLICSPSVVFQVLALFQDPVAMLSTVAHAVLSSRISISKIALYRINKVSVQYCNCFSFHSIIFNWITLKHALYFLSKIMQHTTNAQVLPLQIFSITFKLHLSLICKCRNRNIAMTLHICSCKNPLLYATPKYVCCLDLFSIQITNLC